MVNTLHKDCFTEKMLPPSTCIALTLCAIICLPVIFTHAGPSMPKANTERVVQPRLAKKIVSIQPETGENGFKVHIIADGKLKDYNAFRTARPHQLVIDLPGVRSSFEQKTLLVDSLLVKKIQLTTQKNKVRIVFDLFPIAELPYKVFSKGNQLIVAFGSVAGSPIAEHAEKIQPVGTSGKKEEVEGEYVEKTAPTRAPEITAIEVEKDEQGAKVHIVANGKLTRYEAFYLSDPPRLAVDLFGVQSAVGKEALLFSNPLVKGVRLGTSYKDKVRVVFDLVSPDRLPYQIVSKSDRLLVFLKQPSDLSTTEPTGKAQSASPSSTADQAGATSAPAELAREKPFATVPPGKIILHISSFKQKDNAENEVQRLGKHGYKTFLAAEEVLGESWLRVYIGVFDDEQTARRIGSELRGKGIVSYFNPSKIE